MDTHKAARFGFLAASNSCVTNIAVDFATGGNAAIYYGRGSARQKKKDLDGALADYNKTIELDPKHALAYANRGVVKALQQKPGAVADFDKAFSLDPSLRATYRQFSEKRRKP